MSLTHLHPFIDWNMTMKVSSISALALAAALGFSTLANAQMPPPPPGGHVGEMAAPPGHEMGRNGMMEHHEMREAMRVKAVHDALNIRPDQEAAYAALVDTMKPDRMDEGRASEGMMREHQAMDAMTTPQRLDMMARMMDEHMGRMREHFQRHASAVRALYTVLNADQRRTFDALPSLMGHPGMGVEMGMGHHGGMRMDDDE